VDIAWLVVCYLDPTLHRDSFADATSAPNLLARYPLQTGLVVNEGIFHVQFSTFPFGFILASYYQVRFSALKGRLEFNGPRGVASVQLLTPPIWLGTHAGPVEATIYIKLGLFGTNNPNQANLFSLLLTLPF
jgi:hypothetical protein